MGIGSLVLKVIKDSFFGITIIPFLIVRNYRLRESLFRDYPVTVDYILEINLTKRHNAVSNEQTIIRAATWQNQQNDCAPSEDSDQPGHQPSLIRVFAVRMKKAWVLSYPLSVQRGLTWVFAWRTVILLVLSCRGSLGPGIVFLLYLVRRNIYSVRSNIKNTCKMWKSACAWLLQRIAGTFPVWNADDLHRLILQKAQIHRCSFCKNRFFFFFFFVSFFNYHQNLNLWGKLLQKIGKL